MPVPSHSNNCITKTFRALCPFCNQEVFFFSCSCGSRIFFDELGSPWPQHWCKELEIKYAIEIIRTSERMSDYEIVKLIEAYAREHDRLISAEFWDIIESELGKKKHELKIVQQEFDYTLEGFSGKVIEIINQVNFYKKIGLDKNAPFSKDLLGELTKNEYVEIRIRDNPDKKSICRELTAYATKSLLKAKIIKRGDVITIRLREAKSSLPVPIVEFIQIH